MGFKVMQRADVEYLNEKLLDADGLLKPISAEVLKTIKEEHLLQWCVDNAIYQLPTTELIEWLREQIGGRTAIEIGAGKSGIGRALGIPATDSWSQTTPELMAYYSLFKQPIVIPPDYVEKLEAMEAIEKYKPEVVVGCFITQKFLPGDEDGNVYGPDEPEIIKKCSYIMVGNTRVHGKKRILKSPHKEYQFPWLRSRAIEQEGNRIWVWDK